MKTNPPWRLYASTVRHLLPEQVVQQVRVRLGRWGRGPRFSSEAPRPLGVAQAWGPRVVRHGTPADPSVLEGRFRFWGEERVLDLDRVWLSPDLGRSWNYPVHYFDALPALAHAARRDETLAGRVRQHVERWIAAHPPGQGPAWEAYPTALRIVNWCDVLATLEAGSDGAWRERVLESLYLQARWLRSHLETHLLGTHLLKDAKALLVAGSVFTTAEARAWREDADALLRREIERQVSADGSHVEPSVLYHDMALADVLDLLNFGTLRSTALDALLWRKARRMLEFASTVETPAGGFPLLGDAGEGAGPSPRELRAYAKRLGITVSVPPQGLDLLRDAGLAVWRDSRQYLVADVGPIGPAHLPGHGHCDSLSFEWHVDGVPIVVDSGTWSYEADAERAASRSTRAHNTIEIDGFEQNEIWAAFRVARRATVRARREGRAIVGTLVPWHDRRLRHVRRFAPGPDGIRITDELQGPGTHRLVSRLHLHPDCEVVARAGGTISLRHGSVRARIEMPESIHHEVREPVRAGSFHCTRFGEPRPNLEIEAVQEGWLPLGSAVVLRPGE